MEYSRTVIDRAHAVYELGIIYSALADLEDVEGRPASAARFEQAALRYGYQVGQPEDCAVSHEGLANYIEHAGGQPNLVLAHRLACAIIRLQISSGYLAPSIHNLVLSILPPVPPSFAQVCNIVEQIEGVRFQEMFAQLPKKAPDGDAAIQMIWAMAKDEAKSRLDQKQEVLRSFEPLLQSIAAAAPGDSEQRAEIEKLLSQLEEKGWKIAGAVHRIWAGERDIAALTTGLDAQDAALVRRVMELAIGEQERKDILPKQVEAGNSPTLDLSDLSSQVRLFFDRARFETNVLSREAFFCIADKEVWANGFPRPIYTKPIYAACHFGRQLDHDDVKRIYEESKKALIIRANIILVIFDKVPSEEAWLEIAVLRKEVQIIPLDYAVIRRGLEQQKEQKELENVLRRFLGQRRNLYNVRDPIADSLNFFGREARANELLDMLASHRPVALFGLRKMGKSSLLKYLLNKADFPVAYVDLQFSSEPKEVFRKILETWQSLLRVTYPAFKWLHRYDPNKPYPSFAANTRDLLSQLDAAGYRVQLGIFIDEIEVIAPPALEAEGWLDDADALNRYLMFARTLRGLVQETDSVALMVVGVDPQINRVSRYAGKQNPFYQFFREEYLGPLNRKDCVQMIRNIGSQMNLRYNDEAASCIADLSGGHPFLARQLCSVIVENLQSSADSLPTRDTRNSIEEITMAELQKAAEDFVRAPQTACLLNENGLWGEVTDRYLWPLPQIEENQSILKELAANNARPESALLAATSNQEARKQSLHELEQRAVINELDELLHIQMMIFQKWIKRYQLMQER